MTCISAHVREECHLSRALDGCRHLDLMPAAGAGDPPRADLPLLGDVPPELRDVLVVDLLHLVAAEVAALPLPGRRGRAGAAAWLLFLGCHPSGSPRTGCRRRSGSSGSPRRL